MASRYGNGDLRTRILKTLDDEVLTKAELAISAINQHELRTNGLWYSEQSASRIPISISNNSPSNTAPVIQCLPLSQETPARYFSLSRADIPVYYRTDCSFRSFPLTILLESLNSLTFAFVGSFKNKCPTKRDCEYYFDIQGHANTRRNQDGSYSNNVNISLPRASKKVALDCFYFCLVKNDQKQGTLLFGNVVTGSIRIEFYNSSKEAARKTTRERPQTSRIGVRESEGKVHVEEKLKAKDRKPASLKSIRVKSESSHQNQEGAGQIKGWLPRLNKNQNGPLRQMANSLAKIEPSEKKKLAEIIKQKERILAEKIEEQKSLISLKQKQIQARNQQEKLLTLSLVTFAKSVALITSITTAKDQYCQKLHKQFRPKVIEYKFCLQIKQYFTHSSQKCIANRKNRNLAEIRSGMYLTSHCLQKTGFEKAAKTLIKLLDFYVIGQRVNQSFDSATSFRRKLRFLQRSWKSKYWNRIEAFKIVTEQPLKKMLLQHPPLRIFEHVFFKESHYDSLCKEFMKQITMKFNHMHAAYLERLAQIQRINKSNKAINLIKSAPKKPILKILKLHQPPYWRYFRDIDTLVSMIRRWFEIELQKHHRKAKLAQTANQPKQLTN